MHEKGIFFAKRICLRALEVDWWIQNYFIIKWVWFYNIFARIASLRPPRIRGPGGFQMVRCRTRRIQLGLNQTANLLLNSYFDIIFSWTKVQTNGRTVSTVLTIPKYKRIIFGNLFWKQLALNNSLENFSNAKPPILALLIDFHLETSYCEKIKSSSIEVDWGQFGKQVYSNQLEPRGWFQLTV